MNKRIIAREGLIILSFVGIGSLIYFNSYLFVTSKPLDSQASNSEQSSLPIPEKPAREKQEKIIISKLNLPSNFDETIQQMENVEKLGLNILFIGYPSYLLMRFIFWAVRTLRNKGMQ